MYKLRETRYRQCVYAKIDISVRNTHRFWYKKNEIN